MKFIIDRELNDLKMNQQLHEERMTELERSDQASREFFTTEGELASSEPEEMFGRTSSNRDPNQIIILESTISSQERRSIGSQDSRGPFDSPEKRVTFSRKSKNKKKKK